MSISDKITMEDHLVRVVEHEKRRVKEYGLSAEYDPAKDLYGSLPEMFYRLENVTDLSSKERLDLINSITQEANSRRRKVQAEIMNAQKLKQNEQRVKEKAAQGPTPVQ